MSIARSIGTMLVATVTGLAPGGASAEHLPLALGQAGPGPLLAQPSHLRVTDVPLAEALAALSRGSGIALAYSPSMIPAERRVTCDCDTLAVGAALDRLLSGTGFTYREAAGQVILTPAVMRSVAQPAAGDVHLASTRALGIVSDMLHGRPAMPVPIPVAPVLLRAATITGRVTSEGGSPVLGAQVTLVRALVTGVTDASGNYRLIVPTERVLAGADTLRVERIGYATARVPVELREGDIRVDVTLDLQAVALDQIVVTGTAGNRERKAQAAVVATIDAAAVVRNAPVENITQVLESRVPGITITEGSGTTGSSSRINIRGAASISLSNQPLVFIDGVRMDSDQRALVSVGGQTLSALNDLNPNDIERIEVVKGPAAATLYGADASAGVIQIITKKGSAGSRRFTQSITAEYGQVEPNFTPYANYAKCPSGLTEPDSPNPLCRGQSAGTIVSDNPLARENAFDNGWSGSLQYSGEGGGENFGFYVSAGLDREDGTTRGNELDRRTARASFNWVASPKVSVDATFGVARNRNELPQGDQSTYGYLIAAGLGNPLTVSDASGVGLTGGWLLGTQSVDAIAAILSRVTTLRTTPSAQVRYNPVPWFTNRFTFGADINQSDALEFYPKNDNNWYSGDQANGWVRSTRSNVTTYTLDYTGNISSTFGDADQYTSDLSIGSQYIDRTEDVLRGTGVGLSTNSANLVSGAATNSAVEGYSRERSLGFFAQEQVGYRDRLFLQFGARLDRNSAFGVDAGSFFLPKVGVSYVLSETDFGRTLAPLVSTLRLRAAYGTTGRSPTPGASLETYVSAPYVTSASVLQPGVVPLNPGNPDLQPERGTEFEAGFDAGFFDERAGLELTFYNKKTTDLLLRVPQPPSSGFVQGGASSPYENIGEVVNRGLEVSLRATLLDRNNVTWDATLNGATLHNELISLGNIQPFLNSYRAFTTGRQLGAWYVNRIRSVDTLNNVVTVSDTAEYLGDQIAKLQGSFNTTLTLFNNLRISALFDGKSGYRLYNLGQEYRDRFFQNSAAVVLPPEQGGYDAAERLRRFGPYIGESSGQNIALTEVKEDYIQSGDFVRFRELTATLNLPAAWVQRFGANAASLTVGGRNLALWTKFDGFDPEILGTGPGSANSTFYDQFYIAEVFTTPPARRWIARLNFQF